MLGRRQSLCAGLVLSGALAVGGCGAAGGTPAPSARSAGAAVRTQWREYVHFGRVLDVVGPRSDGSMVVAAGGKLWLLGRSGHVRSYPGPYASSGGEEAYIALAQRAPGCSFHPDTVYALRLHPPRGIVAIAPAGRVRQFARITVPGLINGIAFDRTGHFGHRMLVTVNAGSRTAVLAIGCHGAVRTITRRAPRVEGGIAVAPASFGHFGGDLIAPDEIGGKIFAITPSGRAEVVADSKLPHGQDIGVESEGFVRPGADALVADRLTPGNRHPGDGFLLRIRAASLAAAGVRAGWLLVVSEGGARTDAVRCGASGCSVRHVADGPPAAHGEGHVAFQSVNST